MSNFTDEQLEAVNKDGTNIIVSAGAGSGKTTVLTARVIRKVMEGIDINKLLILTFTNEAAFNMKAKIRKELKKNNMIDALDYIDQAYITTFDSYALSIVKKYHYLLNLSKNINIIDSAVINIKRKEILDDIFNNLYGDEAFDKLISNFTFKDDETLKKYILKINSSLDLKYDKQKYLDKYINDYYTESNIDNLINEYIKLIYDKKDSVILIIDEISKLHGEYGTSLYESFNSFINASTYEELSSIKNIEIPRLPNGTSLLLGDLKTRLSKLQDELKDMLQDNLEYVKKSLFSTKDYVEVIINIIKELDDRIHKFKSETDNYEFNDISKMAIKVVKENDEVRNELKYYFKEIMVDEYQDTSDLQEMFVSLISNHNVYMVGDIKQSIYRFRNANPDIFRNKYNNYSKNIDGYKIDLLKNFRSREEVINSINKMFDYIMDDKIGNADYRISHRMDARNASFQVKSDKQNYNLEIYNYNYDKEYKQEEIEAFIIANDIKNKIENHYQILDNGVLRDFTYSDACIIMDRGKYFDLYKKIFEYMSIPLVMYQDEKMNEEKDIFVIKNLVNLIIKIHNNDLKEDFKYYFISIARSYLFEYSDDEIFEIFKNNKFKETDIYKKAYEIALDLDVITNKLLIERIIDKFNIYESTLKIGDVNKSFIRIEYIINLAKSLSNFGYTPYEFGDYLLESINNDIKYSINDKMGNNVRVMNIHKSKGLEFNVCYFSGFYMEFNTEDLKDSFIYSNKYGIITPFFDDGIGESITKRLYKNEYILNEISERIRLLYVALTRAKEKMIIVAPLDEKEYNISNLVPDEIRLKYSSFLDIINSLKNKIEDYIIDIDYHKTPICNNYDIEKNIELNNLIEPSNEKIMEKNINIDNNVIEESHYSKSNHKLYDIDEKNSMKFGTYMHYLFQITDFLNPNIDFKYKDKILNFISKLDLNNVKIYKEYEFIYEEDNDKKHGIIDLMLEYEDHINIYDYKLKNISDEAYFKQVDGYKKYIENKTKKPVNTYLYSIFDDKLEEINSKIHN